jgi:hypothetical protein
MKARVCGLAVLVAASLTLTGCSADDVARGQLAQTAGTSASVTRSAALAIGLRENDNITSAVLDTALADVAQKLGEGEASLASLAATGGIAAQRDRIIAEVRSAGNTVHRVQASLAAGRGDGDALDAQRIRLGRVAARLEKLFGKLEGAG